MYLFYCHFPNLHTRYGCWYVFFFQSVSGAELGWKVHKNAVECPVRLSGGKPGPVLTYISGGILWSKMQVI